MEKLVNNIFSYNDYRALLNYDYEMRNTKNPKYSIRAHARKLSISPGFLSHILRGNRHLAIESATKIAYQLGFRANEIEFFKNLVLSQTGKSEIDRFNARNRVYQFQEKRIFESDSSLDFLYKNLDCFLIYGLCRFLTKLSDLELASEKLGIPKRRFAAIFKDLLENGLVIENDHSIFITNSKSTLPINGESLKMLQKLSLFILNKVENSGGIAVPNRVCHGLIVPLNQETFNLVQDLHKQFIKALLKISKEADSTDRFMILTDFLYVVDLYS